MGPRVLLVQEEAAVAQEVAGRLHALGYEVLDIVRPGEEPVRRAAELQPDLVLIDTSLPGAMDAVAAAAEIHTGLDIPVVYLTGCADETMQERAQAALPCGCVPAPFESRALANTMEMALARHTLVQELQKNEQALRQERDLAAAILDTVGALIVVLDLQGRIRRFNRACEETTGYAAAEVQGQHFWDLFLEPEEVTAVRAVFERLRTGDFPSTFENHWRTRGGERRLIAWTNTTLADSAGRIEYVIGTGIDVTEKRQAEDALRASEQKFRSLFNALPIGVSILDEERRLIDVNPALERILDMPRAALLAGNYAVRKYLRADGTPMPLEEMPSVRAYRQQQMIQGTEIGIEKADGETIWVSVGAAPLELPGLGAAVTTMDITGMKRVEAEREALLQQTEDQRRNLARLTQALQQERDTLEVVMENTPAMLAYLDPQFNFILANPAYVAGSGHTLDELIGRNHFALFPNAENQALFEQVRDTGQPVRFLAKPFEFADQPWRGVTYWDWTLMPVKDGAGKVQGLVFSLLDITQRKQAEESLQQRNRDLRLLNRLSQELGALHDLPRLLNRVSQAVHEVLPGGDSSIWLRDQEQSQQLICQARSDAGVSECPLEVHLPAGEGLAGWVVDHGESAIVGCVRDDPRCSSSTEIRAEFRGGSVLAAPIQVSDAILGALEVVSEKPDAFGGEDLVLVETLAAATAIAIENIYLHEQARQSAVAGERSRLARELHDAVSQTLFSASVIAESLPRLWERNPERVRQGLEQLQQLTRGALSEMRTLLLELRPAALAEGRMGDLLQQLVDAFASRNQVTVTLDASSQRPLPERQKVALYRIVQEALNNVSKHARATRVEISLRDRGDQVELRVTDNGRGFDSQRVPPDRLGLGILHERAEAIGAALHLDSRPGEGTEIQVLWPARPGEESYA